MPTRVCKPVPSSGTAPPAPRPCAPCWRCLQPPDAVFCFSDLLAVGAISVLHEAGLRIPDDVAVAGFDNVDEARFTVPPLTTIAPDKAEIGRLAVDLLIQRITGARTAPPERFEPGIRACDSAEHGGARSARRRSDGVIWMDYSRRRARMPDLHTLLHPRPQRARAAWIDLCGSLGLCV